MSIVRKSKKIEADIIKYRRDLHEIAECGFELNETSEYIQNKLSEFNIEYRIVAKTGIIATILCKEGNQTIAIRADMDALPIHEETDLPFKSKNKNSMHACGHDAHVAMLLGVARIISENKELLTNNVRLIFQPAEETTGGAKIMIEEGCLLDPKVDWIYGLHIGSIFQEVGNGQVGIKYDGMMASVDTFKANVKGKGGHIGRPHQGVDPILTSVEMIIALQKIVSKEIHPAHPSVISIGKFNSGTTTNIIPETATFEGGVRLINPMDREFTKTRIIEILNNVATANRATVDIEYNAYYPAVVNETDATNRVKEAAKRVVGEKNLIEILNPSLGSEDMSYYLNEIPGSFFILGSSSKNIDGSYYPHHNSKFDIDEKVLWIGTATFLDIIFN